MHEDKLPNDLLRSTSYLEHPVLIATSPRQKCWDIHILESKDLSLNTSMIPLGSCTMKLNSTTEMEAVTGANMLIFIHSVLKSKQKDIHLFEELGDPYTFDWI